MKSTHMNQLISQLNGCLGWTKFGVIGLDHFKAAELLEKWIDWCSGETKSKVKNESFL